MYYVYEWYREDLNLPYYIGKGQGKRAYDLKRNRHADFVTNFLLSNGLRRDVRILAHFETEDAAFEFEKERISFWWYLKEHDILTNQTLGGEGTSGFNHSKRTCKKISDAKIKNNPMHRQDVRDKNRDSQIIAQNKPEVSKKKSDALIAMGDNHPSKRSEVQKKISITLSKINTGSGNPNYGKKASPETNKKRSASVRLSRSLETEEQKKLRGKRIWETRRRNKELAALNDNKGL